MTRSDDGHEISLGTLGPGTVFGEVGFTGGVGRTATVRAKGPATVMTLDREQTHRALRFYPRIAVKLYANIGGIMGDRLMGFGAKYKYSDNLEFKLYGRRFRGSDASQFGRWRDNDHVELGLFFKF